MLLRTAIAEGVEYVDLEEDIAGSIPRFGKTKRIISYHDFRKTPDDLDEIHARLAALDADIVKIATMGNQPHDNVRILRLMRDARRADRGHVHGRHGHAVADSGGALGTPFTYATFHHERTLAPGQLSYQQMNEIYHYDQINSETEVYGVIGDPIGHTLSPQIHNAALRRRGHQHGVCAVSRAGRRSQAVSRRLPRAGRQGLSVTIPHKEAVIPKLTKIDPDVKGIGAANTVVWDGGSFPGTTPTIARRSTGWSAPCSRPTIAAI